MPTLSQVLSEESEHSILFKKSIYKIRHVVKNQHYIIIAFYQI